VALTGYTDKTGDVAKNEELAKSRASAVRDALKAAGVAEASVEMKPPMFVEVGAGGSDAEARRVEINKQ
jgi:outer membrane protein OmpA-like peptidoglycan-associated protein